MKKFFKFGCLGIIGLVVLVVIIGIAASGGDDAAKTSSDKSNTTNEPAAKEEPKKESPEGVVTKEKFEQIKDGMTYEEVVALVGAEGKLLSETGTKGDSLHTAMYEFEADGVLSNVNMTFQGEKLVNKAQFGLEGEDSKGVSITIDEFNKIQNGMTYDQVKEIIGGDGDITSETGEAGTSMHTVMYEYPGEGGLGANASLMFQGGKLMNKSQFGLE